MVKTSLSSVIYKKKKEQNTGSVEFQVVSFNKKIQILTSHLELHKKDLSSQRGLRKILAKRQRLLNYLAKKRESTIKINT
nr:ribosomal protein S15 [Utricularia graminifolia]WOC91447.1 ribosomal protein S15 [Utricularia graminifolia]